MIARIRAWMKRRAEQRHAAWLRRNKVMMPRVPSWDRAAKYYADRARQELNYLTEHPNDKPF